MCTELLRSWTRNSRLYIHVIHDTQCSKKKRKKSRIIFIFALCEHGKVKNVKQQRLRNYRILIVARIEKVFSSFFLFGYCFPGLIGWFTHTHTHTDSHTAYTYTHTTYATQHFNYYLVVLHIFLCGTFGLIWFGFVDVCVCFFSEEPKIIGHNFTWIIKSNP